MKTWSLHSLYCGQLCSLPSTQPTSPEDISFSTITHPNMAISFTTLAEELENHLTNLDKQRGFS
jgi:hypothetical protein